jgi:L-lactate utilization protein LutB
MKDPIKHYWQVRLEDLKDALEANNFEVFIAEDGAGAKDIVLQTIIPAVGAKRISQGDSSTCSATGLFEAIESDPELEFLEPFGQDLPFEEMMERLRRTLTVDLFITGTNAVTEAGQLVNLDMIGNRVGGITFGPKAVVVLVGRNKVAPDLEAAMRRVKDYAAPANAARLDKRTPCVRTGRCMECKGQDRICNVWSIVEKSFPKGRVKVILINEDLGL